MRVPDTYDVAVVGGGPTGLTLAIQLAQHGHQVLVVERHTEHYPLPRAVVFDSETARGLAACGIADRFDEIREIGDDYVWLDAEGELLLRLPAREVGESGWPDSNMMSQPVLEQALAARAEQLPTLTFRRGATVLGLEIDPATDAVRLTADMVDGPASWTARYVVGADGAASLVRQQMDTTLEDLGFFYDWLIVDLVLENQDPWVPMNRQLCDTQRPTTMVSGGPGRRRWEFMRMPGEGADFNSDETAWHLLAKWGVTPDNARLERRALYTFQARWAERWRDGPLLIAGDAAHLMPPFAGMGMCSGIRDSVNLAWKLDLVLRDIAAPELLDTYSTERSAHVRNAIHLSVELGKVICEIDPSIAARRDAHLKSSGADPQKALPPIPPASLGDGALQHDAAGHSIAPAGQLAPHPRLRSADGREGWADEIVGGGLILVIDADATSGAHRLIGGPERLIKELGATVVALSSGPAAADAYVEAGTGLLAAMRAASYDVAILRPDFYFYGGAALGGLNDLLAQLTADLFLAPGHRTDRNA